MIVSYRCRCFRGSRDVEIADRTEGQDYLDWLGGEVAEKISKDHEQVSPHCKAVSHHAKLIYEGPRQ